MSASDCMLVSSLLLHVSCERVFAMLKTHVIILAVHIVLISSVHRMYFFTSL